MPTTLFIYDIIGDTVNGTAGDDFIIGRFNNNSASETLNGGDGDDYILGDCGSQFNAGTSNSLLAPFNIDQSDVWTTDENPFIANATTTPHTTLYVLTDAGQTHYTSVTIGAGQTITVDIDLGTDHPIGVDTDLVVELYNSLGELVISNDDGVDPTLGGAGSLTGFDSFLTFTNAGGASEVYTIRFREFGLADGGVFEGGETFVANISVTGHNLVSPSAMGNDILNGGNGHDTLAGQGGNDSLDGGAGNDTLFGGSGNDTASYALGGPVLVNLATVGTQDTFSAGFDTLTSIENLIGSGFNDTLTGDGTNNILSGGIGNDSLSGADGNDTLDGGVGEDSLDGGDGNDIASYAAATSAVTVNLAVGIAQNTLGAGFDTLTAIEDLIGSAFGDTLTGNAGANSLNGHLGNDVLRGAGGNDSLIGIDGNDTLDGGAGDDDLDGGDGIDVAYYATATGAVRVDLGIAAEQDTLGAGIDRLTAVENVTGSAFNDTLTGNNGANSLNGYIGNDVLYGGAGADNLIGGDGNDTLDGGNGIDLAYYAAATGAVRVNLGLITAQDTFGAGIDTLTAVESITGSAFNDTLTGNNGANALNGYLGNDVLYGGAGADNLVGGEGNDAMDGGSGNDILNGGNGIDGASYATATAGVAVNLGIVAGQNTLGSGIDTLTAIENVTGSGFADTLIGGAASNRLSGGGGNDTLNGRGGNDVLTGGAGQDSFRFDTPLGAATNVDVLTDFSAVDDTILLGTAVFTGIGAGPLSAFVFQLGTAANDADDRIIYDSATGRIYYDADGNGAGAQTLFARVAVGTVLTSADFVAQAPAAEALKTADAPLGPGLAPWRAQLDDAAFGRVPIGDAGPYQPLDYFFT